MLAFNYGSIHSVCRHSGCSHPDGACPPERIPLSLVAHDDLPEVMVNDNRRPAGTLDARDAHARAPRGRRSVAPGRCHGSGARDRSVRRRSSPLQAPAPLIRVPEGTEIVASIRNDLDVSPARARTLRARRRRRARRSSVPAGEQPRGAIQERAAPGRITTGRRRPACRCRSARHWTHNCPARSSSIRRAPTPDADRVFVITEWTSLTADQLQQICATRTTRPRRFSR